MNKKDWIALLKKLNSLPPSSKLILGAVLVGLIVLNWAPTLFFHPLKQEQSTEERSQ
jgi:hypothetical protein